MTRVLAIVCRASELEEKLQESIDYYHWIEARGAVQARHGATGIGRLWTNEEQADVRGQLGMPANDEETP
jgi:hypothetical protein